jgi:hypothetical protein
MVGYFRANHAAGVSSLTRFAGKFSKLGSTALRYSRTGICSLRHVSTIEIDRGHPRTSLLTSDMDPVLAADCHRAHRVFSCVVTEFQLGMIQEASESVSQLECVFTRFGRDTQG